MQQQDVAHGAVRRGRHADGSAKVDDRAAHNKIGMEQTLANLAAAVEGDTGGA